jgi:hypothetical protein
MDQARPGVAGIVGDDITSPSAGSVCTYVCWLRAAAVEAPGRCATTLLLGGSSNLNRSGVVGRDIRQQSLLSLY